MTVAVHSFKSGRTGSVPQRAKLLIKRHFDDKGFKNADVNIIEKAIEGANNNGIDKIYYVAIWDDEGNEILRDKYERKDGQSNKVKDGNGYYTYEELQAFTNSIEVYCPG